MYFVLQQHLVLGLGENRHAMFRSQRWYDATDKAYGNSLVSVKLFSFLLFSVMLYSLLYVITMMSIVEDYHK